MAKSLALFQRFLVNPPPSHDAVNPLSRCASHREPGDEANRGHRVVVHHPATQNTCQSKSSRYTLLVLLWWLCYPVLILHWDIPYDALSVSSQSAVWLMGVIETCQLIISGHMAGHTRTSTLLFIKKCLWFCLFKYDIDMKTAPFSEAAYFAQSQALQTWWKNLQFEIQLKHLVN